jgi:hypothetical protein
MHRPRKPDPARLSLAQHFTAAALAGAGGIAAAWGANEAIVPVVTLLYDSAPAAFFINFGALFAATGGLLGWTEETLRQHNEKRLRARPWGLPRKRLW